MNYRQKFSQVAAKQIGNAIAVVGDNLRREPGRTLPVPAEYKIGMRTTWDGNRANVTITLDDISVTQRFTFHSFQGADAIRPWFYKFAELLWTEYLKDRL